MYKFRNPTKVISFFLSSILCCFSASAQYVSPYNSSGTVKSVSERKYDNYKASEQNRTVERYNRASRYESKPTKTYTPRESTNSSPSYTPSSPANTSYEVQPKSPTYESPKPVELTSNRKPFAALRSSGLKPARIINSGDLHSTYQWKSQTTKTLGILVGSSKVEEVKMMSNETSWPTGLVSLSLRMKKNAYFSEYNTFYKGLIKEGVALLWVPAAENTKMPPEMRSDKDIYFVIAVEGIEIDQ
ncbi:MAG: hypothetical protein Q8891_14610 [Bacteroidota bacterium]|nr:hypothetical protein [Bacteroidota bacterium]